MIEQRKDEALYLSCSACPMAVADIVGFTAMSAEMPPDEVVTLLSGLFTRFGEAADELGIEKWRLHVSSGSPDPFMPC